jgi:uncharacterized protein (DUF362 family)
MKCKKPCRNSKGAVTRRYFLSTLSKTTAGLFIAPYIRLGNIGGHAQLGKTAQLAQVALTQHNNYDRIMIKDRVQHLFDALGGISDVVSPGDKVAIKINLTGGSYWGYQLAGQGIDITECMWTHPEVVRAVGELLIDSGVNADDIYIVEALWDAASYNNFGYLTVQQDLGAQLVNLENKDPYSDYVFLPVGPNSFYYTSFKVNKILEDADVYISIPKMKQHYNAGVTHSLKNQIGMVPLQFYRTTPGAGKRDKLHTDGGDHRTHLPRSICDLNFARPVHLAVIDGIKNAIGGAGAWHPTFQLAEYDVLLAGKDPVATDSIASYLMGNDPEPPTLQLPDGQECDNHLYLLHQKGVGTNQMSEIQPVGDGAGLVGVIPDYEFTSPDEFKLAQNFPNPFNAQTTIGFYMPHAENVTIKLYDITGREIDTFMNGLVPSGLHELQLNTNHLASGVYVYRMQAGRFSDSRKMILQK